MFTHLSMAISVTIKTKGFSDDSLGKMLTTQHVDLSLSPRTQGKKPHVIMCAWILVLEVQTGESLGLAGQTA